MRLYRVAVGLVIAGVLLLAGVLVLNGGIASLFDATPPPSATATRTRVVPEVATLRASETSAAAAVQLPSPSTSTATPEPTEPVPPTLTASPTATPQPTETSLPIEMPTETAVPADTVTPSVPPTSTVAAAESGTPAEPTVAVNSEEVAAAPEANETTIVPAGPVADFGSVFDNRVWVGLYGTPAGRGLGILGTASATETVTMTVQQAIAYQVQLTGTQVVPFFHMVTTIADPHPGADGDYVHRVSTPTIQSWIYVAQANGVLSVLDIQPGHSPITTELAYVEPFLRQPGVHLAVDPEFMMLDGVSVPGHRIGSMTGELVNAVQAWLSGVAEAVGERKALVIHQFDDRMFSGKDVILDYPLVDLVWDADGFGGPGAKIGDYRQYAGEPGFEHGGFKLFYNYDVPVMLPEQVLEIEPRPVFVVYQ